MLSELRIFTLFVKFNNFGSFSIEAKLIAGQYMVWIHTLSRLHTVPLCDAIC